MYSGWSFANVIIGMSRPGTIGVMGCISVYVRFERRAQNVIPDVLGQGLRVGAQADAAQDRFVDCDKRVTATV